VESKACKTWGNTAISVTYGKTYLVLHVLDCTVRLDANEDGLGEENLQKIEFNLGEIVYQSPSQPRLGCCLTVEALVCVLWMGNEKKMLFCAKKVSAHLSVLKGNEMEREYHSLINKKR